MMPPTTGYSPHCHATTGTVPETARRRHSTKADFIRMREQIKGAPRLIACVGKAAGLYKQHPPHESRLVVNVA